MLTKSCFSPEMLLVICQIDLFIRILASLGFSSTCLQLPQIKDRNFPGGVMVKNLSANAGDMGSIPGLGRSHMPRSN